VSSDDGLASEARERQLATEVAGLLRELQDVCRDPTGQSNPVPETIRNLLDTRLLAAIDLLAPDESMKPTIESLRLEFGAAEEINSELVRQNMIPIAVIARAIEDRFHLRGGGYGGYGFSILQSPQLQQPEAI
jgi:hypothetical protein